MTAIAYILEKGIEGEMLTLGGFFATLSNKINKVVLVSEDHNAKHGEIIKATAGINGLTVKVPPVNAKKTLMISIEIEDNSLGDVTYTSIEGKKIDGQAIHTIKQGDERVKLVSIKGKDWKKWS